MNQEEQKRTMASRPKSSYKLLVLLDDEDCGHKFLLHLHR